MQLLIRSWNSSGRFVRSILRTRTTSLKCSPHVYGYVANVELYSMLFYRAIAKVYDRLPSDVADVIFGTVKLLIILLKV